MLPGNAGDLQSLPGSPNGFVFLRTRRDLVYIIDDIGRLLRSVQSVCSLLGECFVPGS